MKAFDICALPLPGSAAEGMQCRIMNKTSETLAANVVYDQISPSMEGLNMTDIALTPTQIRGLKLAKDGDLFPQDAKKWTHQNAVVTYAKTDKFKERPQKIKFLTTTTLDELRGLGLLRTVEPDAPAAETAHEITMAGKIWLLKNK